MFQGTVLRGLSAGLGILLLTEMGQPVTRGSSTTAYLPVILEPSTIVVTGMGDTIAADGACTLREAVRATNFNMTVNECAHGGYADQPDTIIFDTTLNGATIVITESAIEIAGDLTIQGLGQDQLTISGNNESEIFWVNASSSFTYVVAISDMALKDGSGLAGGIYNDYGDTTITDVAFSGHVGQNGAAANNSGGRLTIKRSTFIGNTSAIGGAIYTSAGTLTVIDSAFLGNGAESVGGAIYIGPANLATVNEIRGTHFIGNAAAQGAAIDNDNDDLLMIVDTTISENTASGRGGGIHNDGALQVRNSTLSGNKAHEGGGIYLDHGTATVTNSTISGNNAIESGGGIFAVGTFFPASLIMANVTIASNGAALGGGLYNLEGQLAIQNSQIVDNESGGDCYLAGGTFIASGANLASDGTCPGFTIPAGNAHLGPLQNNGGPTATHALGSASDALDAADNGLCAAPPVDNFDQRGLPRPRDGDGDGTPICDLGSFEVQ